MSRRPDRIPLLPLSDVVCFPCTRLGLRFEDPRHQPLIADLESRDESHRLLGTVLVRPGELHGEPGRRAIFPGGTVGRVIRLERLADGRSEVALIGESRFTVTRELGGGPYRRAEVEMVPEPELREDDAGIVAVRRELVALSSSLGAAGALGPSPDLTAEGLAALGDEPRFEALVNRLAAELDLPAVRKLALLIASLPERALGVLAVLRSRRRVVELLRPFRRLAAHPDRN